MKSQHHAGHGAVDARRTKSNNNKRQKIRQLPEKLAVIGSIILLVIAWVLGGARLSNLETEQLSHLLPENAQIVTTDQSTLKITTNTGQDTQWLSQGSGVGYGGKMDIALMIDDQGVIKQLAILSSRETASYLQKIIAAKFPEQVVGQSIQNILQVDAISGATLSSSAILRGANLAAEPVRQELMNLSLVDSRSPWSYLGWMDLVALLAFAAAWQISKTRHSQRKKMEWGLMLTSLVLFGFYASALFSSSTLGILISGTWISGLGNYTPLILLVLTVVTLLTTNKNLYCDMICPFGTTQQCLAKITNPPTVTLKHSIFTWLPRVILLAVLAAGLYFRNPATIAYEPFGIMFGMTGSIQLFILTFVIILTSLMIYRPWCKTLCPVGAMTDFLKFIKAWGKQGLKDYQRKTKTTSARPANNIPHRSLS
ncbi:FMN-binding protein [Endozoicomonas atrinae]|uniref:FMN-binding protein n=1 Tax=Endozoicomonas atrinae TaxID=1333660 RepID=UPI003B00878E